MLNRLVYHWTAGTYAPNYEEKKHYHYLVDGNGKVVRGYYKPEDNDNCTDGIYARHTGGGNTGAIGISYCGMNGFKNPREMGLFPLKKAQVEAGFKLGAELIKKYNIPLEGIKTHYTFGKAHPKTSSFGKIDIYYFPCYPDLKPHEVLPFIKNKVNWYSKHVL